MTVYTPLQSKSTESGTTEEVLNETDSPIKKKKKNTSMNQDYYSWEVKCIFKLTKICFFFSFRFQSKELWSFQKLLTDFGFHSKSIFRYIWKYLEVTSVRKLFFLPYYNLQYIINDFFLEWKNNVPFSRYSDFSVFRTSIMCSIISGFYDEYFLPFFSSIVDTKN